MTYIGCKICDVVVERRAVWQGINNIYDHIRKEHPDLIKEIELAEENYEEKIKPLEEAIAKIEKPLSLRDYVSDESLPIKGGREEYKGKIISFYKANP